MRQLFRRAQPRHAQPCFEPGAATTVEKILARQDVEQHEQRQERWGRSLAAYCLTANFQAVREIVAANKSDFSQHQLLLVGRDPEDKAHTARLVSGALDPLNRGLIADLLTRLIDDPERVVPVDLNSWYEVENDHTPEDAGPGYRSTIMHQGVYLGPNHILNVAEAHYRSPALVGSAAVSQAVVFRVDN